MIICQITDVISSYKGCSLYFGEVLKLLKFERKWDLTGLFRKNDTELASVGFQAGLK